MRTRDDRWTKWHQCETGKLDKTECQCIFLVCTKRGERRWRERSHEARRDKRARDERAAAAAVAAEGAVARDEMREGRVEEAEDRDVNHNM